jgi:hypothetical protein
MKDAITLIEEADEALMRLRVKSQKEPINEKELYDVQTLLCKALDQLRPSDVMYVMTAEN